MPLERYVATVQLKPVTDGRRTFWHWQSTFRAPRGRERELAELVGRDVYEEASRALRATSNGERVPGRAGLRPGQEMAATAVVFQAAGEPDVLVARAVSVPPPDRARYASPIARSV